MQRSLVQRATFRCATCNVPLCNVQRSVVQRATFRCATCNVPLFNACDERTNSLFSLIVQCLLLIVFSVVCAGGWELIYDFVSHLVGEASDHKGVPMHIGHFGNHVNGSIKRLFGDKVKGFFIPRNWRTFVQSGTALWLRSLGMMASAACCDVPVIGCDGTPIGIPNHSISAVDSVWQPTGTILCAVCLILRDWGVCWVARLTAFAGRGLGCPWCVCVPFVTGVLVD